MKKVVSMILVIAMLVLSALGLCSCGKTTECDFCGEKKRCKAKLIVDEKIYVCDDCMDELEDWVD